MTDPATLAYYEQNAPFYTASTAEFHHRHLDPFLSRLPSGSFVLELGCGSGCDARRILDAGYRLDATDGAAAMVRKAKERFDVDARQMRFDELDASETYDAVWAHASLLHATRAALPGILGAIHTALKPGGLHFANYKLADDIHRDEGPDLLGRWTNLPSPNLLEDLYSEAGFSIIERDRFAGKGSDGTQRDWLALTLRKDN